MKNSISFTIFKGDKYYVAEGVGVPVVTQGKTLDQLSKNIIEAVTLYLESPIIRKKFSVKKPSIFMNIQLPAAYAQA